MPGRPIWPRSRLPTMTPPTGSPRRRTRRRSSASASSPDASSASARPGASCTFSGCFCRRITSGYRRSCARLARRAGDVASRSWRSSRILASRLISRTSRRSCSGARGGAAAEATEAARAMVERCTLVHEVGGLTSAAHLGDHGSEAQIRIFQDQGLDCVEVRHPSHAPAVEQRLTRIAQRLGLGISGGSDWHGESEYGDSHAPLGGMRVPDTWLEPLEHRLELTKRKRDERPATDRQ